VAVACALNLAALAPGIAYKLVRPSSAEILQAALKPQIEKALSAR
jgi:hypothetical protein